MYLSDVSIRNPVFAWMLMLALILFGWISFERMGISQMPDVDFPVINVSLTWQGAAPEVMETNVVDVVEDAVMNVEGVKQVSSSSSYGAARVTIELDLSRDVDVALQEVQSRISQAQRSLPGTLDPPVISKANPEDMPILWLGVSYDGDLKDLMVYVRDVLKNRFTGIEGVGDVRLGGYVDRNLRIWVDSQKLRGRDLTVEDILSAVSREHSEYPAGLIETPRTQYNIRSMGEASTAERFARLPITQRGGMPIFDTTMRISDVAHVEDGMDDIHRISRVNGSRSVGIGIIKQRGSNAVAVAKEVKERLEVIRKELPPGYKIDVSFDSTKFIEESIDELKFTLILAALLTGAVTFLFLGSWGSTVNVLLAIPTSIMGSFVVLYFFGFTLNTFTMLGLTLAIGIVVDDAIMVLENITRHREMGEGLIQGAARGAREITFAAFATSLAIIAIFLPVAFMSGIIGRFFFQFAVTITATVMLSLLEALTLTPMRCSQFLDVGNSGFIGKYMDRLFHTLIGQYHAILLFVLDHRWKVLSASMLVFAASFLLLKPIKKEFSPSMDQSQLLVRLKTPVGSSLEFTNELSKKSEAWIMQQGEVDHYFVAVGSFSGTQPNTALLFVTLKNPGERPIRPEKKKRLSQSEFAQVLRRGLSKISPNLHVVVQDLSMRGFSSSRGFPIEFVIQGPSWDKLARFQDHIKTKMKESGKFTDVDSDYDTGQPEVQIYPDREAAALRGVSVDSIGRTVQAMVGGVKAGQFTEGGHRYDIRVRLEESDRLSPSSIKKLFLRNNRGELVRLSDVVKLQEKPALMSITRQDRQRSITIFANPSLTSSQQEAANLAEKFARETLEPGYVVRSSGSSKTMAESFQSLFFVLVVGIVVAYMILASQFSSYLHPVTVLMAMPFSFSGALVALFVTGQSLNIFSFISLILLMGLVKKNSILLVDFTNRMREQGQNVHDALLHACPLRLRPILMTSFSTIAAAIPPALSVGPGGESRIPMAIAIIGGMIVSTLLTLVVVPVVYSLFSGLERKEYGKVSERELLVRES